jgi:hypothetical protein
MNNDVYGGSERFDKTQSTFVDRAAQPEGAAPAPTR